MTAQKSEEARAVAQASPSLSGGTPGGDSLTIDDLSRRFAEVAQEHRSGLYMTEDHRYFWNGRGPLPSVTTALDVIHRWALTAYRERATAGVILDEEWLRQGETEWDRLAAISAAQQIVDLERDTAASFGTSIHSLAALIGQRPQDGLGAFQITEEQYSFAVAFLDFLGRYAGSEGQNLISSEHAVLSLVDGWGGTYDLILWLPSGPNREQEVWLVDLKTSKGYYPEFGLQLAAYGHGEFIGLPGDPTQYPVPPIARYGVLHIRPDIYRDPGWRLVEYPVTDRDYIAFLAALELYQWQQERRFEKKVLGTWQ